MRFPTRTVTGLLAAGALTVPVAEAAPKDTSADFLNAVNSIPDPSTVPKSTKPVPTFAPEDAPDPGEPADAADGDDDAAAPAAETPAPAVVTPEARRRLRRP